MNESETNAAITRALARQAHKHNLDLAARDARIAELERRLAAQPDVAEYDRRIAELKYQLIAARHRGMEDIVAALAMKFDPRLAHVAAALHKATR